MNDSPTSVITRDNLFVSIALAAYNGERYIEKQILSIHNSCVYANVKYELVIVDDCSSDSTLQIISSLSSQVCINIVSNPSNIGPSKSFEKCLQLCSGDIIFLCDQDDIWLREKVFTTLQSVINKGQGLSNPFLFSGDAILIDEKDQDLGCTFYEARGNYTTSLLRNFMKFRHLGCSMAFSSQIKKIALPFPSYIPQHDIWIYLVAKAYKVPFVSAATPLIKYRRHFQNTSSAKLTRRSSVIYYKSKSTIFFMLKARLKFMVLYTLLLLRRVLNAHR